ncbi:eukaryotic translation initiation factor 5 [Lingula anatina]|uniref:Eukaryotic translation initiation factor 5 n=1 Tax=Lingula anatina TaxID=7574 RepID=A0A1S3IHC6_LINAN|nr:eukaryotic translation initiation factor 5 [Lingula anatina]|eukprot:XP_013397528.1 eukaryotic translation initiation factor 5 [Lingula anatina]
MALNVNRNVSDQFYRYKMPRLIAKVEGKGNGIKTVIANMPEVAKALGRPPTYPTKFFGCELGAQTQFDLKNERFIVNGAHDSAKLQDLLDGFIKKFVLCPECENPETLLSISQKRQQIGQRCSACGYTGMVDMTHKLTTYILKNPPEPEPSTGLTPIKKEKRSKKGRSKDEKEMNGGDGENAPSSPEIKELNAQEQSAAIRSGEANFDQSQPETDGGDDADWGEDVSEEAVKKRMEELSTAAQTLALTEDLEKTPKERADLFYSFVKNKKESGNLIGSDKEILAEAEKLEVKDKAPLILCEVLLSENIVKELKDYRLIFLRITNQNPKAQRYMLGGVEQLIGNVYRDQLMPKVCGILKALYDLDIVDEEVIQEWGNKVSKKYVSKAVAQDIHNAATPFLKWLKEAEEEESDEEEEEEEDLEIEYSNKAPAGQLKTETQVSKEEEEEDDDLDIDAI